MPIRDILDRSKSPDEENLFNELVKELKKPKKTGEPDIVIERPYPATIHLYVIWTKWDDVDQISRSRIILDAFTKARGKKEGDDVTVAMGLTPIEAERLGVK